MQESSFTLFLARHGQTEHNRKRLMQGRSIDAELNELGRRQADLLAERFASVPLAAIYASGLQRARQTARRVAEGHGLPLQTLDLVAEMYWGSLEGQSIDSVAPYLRRMALAWKAGEFDDKVGGGETIRDVQNRASQALDHLVSAHGGGQQVLVVTHGRFLRVLLATALPKVGLRNMDQFEHANTGVYSLDYREGLFHLGLTNDSEHLKPLEQAAS